MIFNCTERSILNHINDPFRPEGLNYKSNNYGALSKPSAKPRKRNPLQMQSSNIPSNLPSNLSLDSSPLPFSVQKRQTKRIRQNLRKDKVTINNFNYLYLIITVLSLLFLLFIRIFIIKRIYKHQAQFPTILNLFYQVQKSPNLLNILDMILMNLMN